LPEHAHRGRPARRAGKAGEIPSKKTISPAREAAFSLLMQVATTSAHSDDLLHGAELRSLSQPDKNLATALVLGVLRWQIALDAEIAKLLDRPDQQLPDAIHIALRMAAFQLRHMDRIPAHAALSESVELVRLAGHPKAAGLVNALLRKLTTKSPARKPIAETVAAMATRLGHPSWIVQRWEASYGRDAARAICDYDQHEPQPGPLFLADNAAEGLDANLIDDGSRLVAEIAAASHAAPQRIWDACAAPGGKTAILAQRHPAAEILATDISARRLQNMQRRLGSQLPQQKIRTLVADAAQLPPAEGSFDLILCDVPCSGTGTLARNPEIRHRLELSDLKRQSARQREILSAALPRLKPGGRLVYSTCSLEPEENEAVIRSVLTQNAARPVPMAELLDQLAGNNTVRESADRLKEIVRDDALRTLPGANFQGDGFFATVLTREP
jgi:16S rRNA (cytosine967-C5)-methyltransferase